MIRAVSNTEKIHEWLGLLAVIGLCTSRLCSGLSGRGAAASENPPYRTSTLPTPLPLTRSASRRSGWVCASLGTWRQKTLSLSIAMQRRKIALLPALLDELVRLKVDVIVAGGPSVTRAAKETTVTIPIVMTWDYDPVGNGFCCQPGTAWRKHYGIGYACAGDKWKAVGALERNHSETFPRSRPGDVDHPRQRRSVEEQRNSPRLRSRYSFDT